MLTHRQNELLTRIGPGTPMGAMLREYWVPACRSAKLEADGAPERIRLFGENFVAFRATDGRVGFMQEACPHRCASLALARNEEQRPALHVPRLEVQRRGQVRRRADRAAPSSASASPPACRCAAIRRTRPAAWCGSTWARRPTPPRFPDYEFTTLAGRPGPALPRDHPHQLAAGARGAARFGARHLPPLGQPDERARAQLLQGRERLHARRRRAGVRVRRAALRLPRRRDPRGRRGTAPTPACARSRCRSSRSSPRRRRARGSSAARSRSTT